MGWLCVDAVFLLACFCLFFYCLACVSAMGCAENEMRMKNNDDNTSNSALFKTKLQSALHGLREVS